MWVVGLGGLSLSDWRIARGHSQYLLFRSISSILSGPAFPLQHECGALVRKQQRRSVFFNTVGWRTERAANRTRSAAKFRRKSDSVRVAWGAVRTVMGRARDGTVRSHRKRKSASWAATGSAPTGKRDGRELGHLWQASLACVAPPISSISAAGEAMCLTRESVGPQIGNGGYR